MRHLKLLLCISIFVFPNSILAKTYTYIGGPIEIPIVGPANPAFIQVENLKGKVVDISVTLHGLEHLLGRSLMLVISSPDGWSTLLWSGIACPFIGNSITFTDNATSFMRPKCGSTTGVPEGQYLPGETGPNIRYAFAIPIAPIKPFFTKMNEMIQDQMDGRWILWAEDFSPGDSGKLRSWEITFTTEDSVEGAPKKFPRRPRR